MKTLKIISVIILVLVLIGLAYVQALFSHQKTDDAEEDKLSSAELKTEFEKSGKYSQLVDSIRGFYIDSILAAEDQADTGLEPALTEKQIDSLLAEMDKTNADLDRAESKIDSLKIAENLLREELIYRFYSREMASLPVDLSDYERSVSVKEIKSKAMKYFDVSAKGLEKIIEKYKK